MTSINFRDVLLACFSSDSHQLTASGALSGDAPRYHRTRRTAHSDGRVLKWPRHLDSASTHSRDQGPRVVCPALPPSRNRLGQRALRNLLGVLARRARKDALELRLHQRLSGRVVPDEGTHQRSSAVIRGKDWQSSVVSSGNQQRTTRAAQARADQPYPHAACATLAPPRAPRSQRSRAEVPRGPRSSSPDEGGNKHALSDGVEVPRGPRSSSRR